MKCRLCSSPFDPLEWSWWARAKGKQGGDIPAAISLHDSYPTDKRLCRTTDRWQRTAPAERSRAAKTKQKQRLLSQCFTVVHEPPPRTLIFHVHSLDLIVSWDLIYFHIEACQGAWLRATGGYHMHNGKTNKGIRRQQWETIAVKWYVIWWNTGESTTQPENSHPADN